MSTSPATTFDLVTLGYFAFHSLDFAYFVQAGTQPCARSIAQKDGVLAHAESIEGIFSGLTMSATWPNAMFREGFSQSSKTASPSW